MSYIDITVSKAVDWVWSKVAKIVIIPNNKFVILIEYLRIMDETPTFLLPY